MNLLYYERDKLVVLETLNKQAKIFLRNVDFHPGFFCFPIIHHNSIFSTHANSKEILV